MRGIRAVMLVAALAVPAAVQGGELSLEDAVMRAMESSPRVAAAHQDAAAARTRFSEVRSNSRLHLNFEFSYIHLTEIPTLEIPPIDIDLSELGTALSGYFSGVSQQLQGLGMPGLPAFPTQLSKTLTLPGFELAEENTRQYALSLQKPLFTGGRVKYGVSQVRNGAAALDAVAESTAREVAYEVVKAYLGAVLARRAVLVNDSAYQAIELHVRQAESLFAQGMIPQYDLMRARTELANQDQKLMEAEAQAALAAAYLNNLMGVPESEAFEFSTTLSGAATETPEFQAAVAEALAASDVMDALEAKGRMYEAGEKAARAERMPVVAAVARQELRDEDLPLTTPEGFYGVVMSMPLYDGGASRAKASHQRALAERNRTDMRRLELGIELEVKKYLLDLAAAEKSLAAAVKGVELAGESLRLAERRYEVGEGTSIEVTDAVLALSIAETNLDRARYQYDVAEYGLKKVMGKEMPGFTGTGGES